MLDLPQPHDLPLSHFEHKTKQALDYQISNCFFLISGVHNNSSLLAYDNIQNYYDLPCSEEDVRKIKDLIKTLATNNYITLWAKHSSRLRKVEKEIYHVHPFRFLAIIHNNSSSKKYFQQVLDDSLLRRNFISGFSDKMERDYRNNNFSRFLESFSEEVHLPKEHIENILLRKDWANLLDYIAR